MPSGSRIGLLRAKNYTHVFRHAAKGLGIIGSGNVRVDRKQIFEMGQLGEVIGQQLIEKNEIPFQLTCLSFT